MRLAVLSFFRNSAHGQAQRFMSYVAALRDVWGPVRLIAVWGDCEDDTQRVLSQHAVERELSVQLIEASHGGPVYGSTEDSRRLRQLSMVCNAGLSSIAPNDELVWYVESDLKWSPETVITLRDRLLSSSYDALAPLVFAGPHFYDIWGYQRNGQRFSPFRPYHPDLNGAILRVDSVGSGFLMHARMGRQCRVQNDMALLGFFEDAREQGFSIAVDPTLRIDHPV